jgi:hypothetical protein
VTWRNTQEESQVTDALKLKIDFAAGTFDAEGDPDQLERLYQDFSDRMAKFRIAKPRSAEIDDPEIAEAETIEDALTVRRRKRPSRSPQRETDDGARVGDYTPTRVKNLDLAGLDASYRQWVTKNHPERILLFAHYLQEEMQISPCTADQIFTCYLQTKEKIPKAFVQAFRDASGNKYGYIDYKSLTDITVTIHGRNQVEHGGIAKRAAVK